MSRGADSSMPAGGPTGLEVAVIGMSCRFPGARSVEEFWDNLRNGVESIRFFSDEELLTAGVDLAVLDDPSYVPARGALDGVEEFDADFFGFTPREAEVLDPQHRLFLETGWEALERAGYDPQRYDGWVGVFAGAGASSYFLHNLGRHPELIEAVGAFQVTLSNDEDFLATRTSYKLDLRGPSLTVQTACSTSLVAVHLACQALLRGECELALAGGVAIDLPQRSGYHFRPGGILSPDGHTRTFDAEARGCVGGSGVGVVLLKRLSDALADGDPIDAVIKGSAINNDGAGKVGFTAPGSRGQALVIQAAQMVADVDPETVTYVEAHGTATELGDPIELSALTRAFRAGTERNGFCAVGSVKTNIGHLDAAAGVAGLIKTVLALSHGEIPPSLNFERPNPAIDFASTPFFVARELAPWRSDGPRRAGVSSFGIGGTNVHVVLEEAPAAEPPSPAADGWRLLPLSARSESALAASSARLADHLEAHPDLRLEDVAYTLQVGRAELPVRRAVVARDLGTTVRSLRDPAAGARGTVADAKRRVAFLFPGQGALDPGFGAGLYREEPEFRSWIDRAADVLAGEGADERGVDLRWLIDPPDGELEEARRRLACTDHAQPYLFAVETALARLWMERGVRPEALLGHSAGEYVAAGLAGVFGFEDGVRLIAARGRLMQAQAEGRMLVVSLSPHELRELLEEDGLVIAAINGPELCVAAGPPAAVGALRTRLRRRRVACRLLGVQHAFHSPAMEPAVEPFLRELRKLSLAAPKIPYFSNLTGTWAAREEATDPAAWARHLTRTVKLEPALRELVARSGWTLLELGPGEELTRLARRHPARTADLAVLSTGARGAGGADEVRRVREITGRLWVRGVPCAWSVPGSEERRRRVVLPTYPFERRRYWVDAAPADTPVWEGTALRRSPAGKRFYLPSWLHAPLPAPAAAPVPGEGAGGVWLVFLDRAGLGEAVVDRLRESGERVVAVETADGRAFAALGDGRFAVAATDRSAHERLLNALAEADGVPARILDLRAVGGPDAPFTRPLALLQALGETVIGPAVASGEPVPVRLAVISDRLFRVNGDEPLEPGKALLLGPVRVAPQEYPGLAVSSIDVVVPHAVEARRGLADRLIDETGRPPDEPVVAWRGGRRWVERFVPAELAASDPSTRLRRGGVYLITGGFGGLGLALARRLAETLAARLVLVGRRELPPRERWPELDDPELRRRADAVAGLEEAGAEVLTATADLSDADATAAMLRAARERFGTLHGTFHAAGVPGGGVLQLLDQDRLEATLAPKVGGTRALAPLLDDPGFELLVLFSSQRAHLGGAGRADYCAANAFLDAFAQAHGDDGRVVAVDWDGWREVGMAARAQAGGEDDDLALGLTPDEGLDALFRVLAARLPQVVVSTTDWEARRREARSATPEAALAAAAGPAAAGGVHRRPDDLSSAYVAPSGAAEEELAAIWTELLGVGPVGAEDSFFELGGDSVVALQLVARAQRTGLRLTARQVMEHQTVAALARAAGTAAEARNPEPSFGEAPPTPIQSWFLDRALPAPHHYNQSAMLALPRRIGATTLERALTELLRRHDALRLRLVEGDGGWRQDFTPPPVRAPMAVVDLAGLPPELRSPAIERATAAVQASLDPTVAPPVRALRFRLPGPTDRLAVVAHHLAIDAVSWRLLFQDLEALCADGDAPEPVGTSYRAWSLRLAELARSPQVEAEADFWTGRPWSSAVSLPSDRDAGSPGTVGAAREVSRSLDEQSTRALSVELPRRGRVEAAEVLLAALAETLSAWAGGGAVAIDVEGHGREAIAPDLDVSGTVGWFTALHPLLLDPGPEEEPGEGLRWVTEQVRAVPRGGVGFGMLRWLGSPAMRERLSALPRREVLFLYTGRVDRERLASGALRPADEPTGPDQSPHNPRSHALEVTVSLEGDRLRTTWTYSPERHRAATVERLAADHLERVRALVAHCLESPGAGYTPSDFPAAGLVQEDLDELLAELE
jgi:non-ribosomal peptide synthase protein (TIGR01720 family)